MSGRTTTSRRRFLARAAGIVGGGFVAATARDLILTPVSAAAPQPPIKPRSAWGEGLTPKGPLPAERPEDVKFLLVHHTAGANGYAQGEVRQTLRGIFDFHTGPTKGWNDVAYNFFVDAFGTIWEGRQGSLTDPIMGSATGGSQGFALLCCFVGDHTKAPPTAAAQTAMTDLLAWLAGTYAIDLRAGATATFVSRGSNLHPAGKKVTTPTISAHRDMSRTSCPGDACYRLVRGTLTQAAAAKASGAPGAPSRAPSVPADPGPSLVVDPDAGAPASTLPPASPTQIMEDNPPPAQATTVPAQRGPTGPDPAGGEGGSTGRLVGLGGLGAAAAVAGAVVLRRRSRAASASQWYSSELLNPPENGSSPPSAGRSPDPAACSPQEAARQRPHLYRPEE